MSASPVAFGHLDADSYYVSAERVRNAFLRGKPVGVLGNQGAAVVAKSYEMKAAGVTTGMPIWEAVRLCPSGVYLKRDFRWYEVLSRRMLEVVRQISPSVEFYSVDEFFFRAVPHRGLSLQETAEALRDRVLKEVGVPVTVGVGRSKTLAKLISDTAKPFGALALLDRDAEWGLLDRHPVTAVSGIADRRAARLEPHGITTCLDLAFADRLLVRELLTRVGEALWYELNGEPVLPLYTDRPPHKVLSRGGSLGGATADPDRVYAFLVRNVERLIEELEFHVVRAGALSVYLMHWDGTEGFGKRDLPSPTDRFDLLLEAARDCFRRAWVPGLAASRMHVNASQLRRPGFAQLGLFEPPAEQARAVAQVKREVNARVGRFVLRSGATLPLADVYRDEAQSYDICDVKGKICF
jgi:nucleotidyltransferase/DNA polymerase involved in DNA repair